MHGKRLVRLSRHWPNSSLRAVAARYTYAEAGVGAVPSQNITDLTLGPRALALMSAGPVHSAGMILIGEVSWSVAGILVDWMEDDPIEALAVAWMVYKLHLDDYLMRAQDPTAAQSHGVSGDE